MSTLSTKNIVPSSFSSLNIAPRDISSKQFTGAVASTTTPIWGEIVWGNFTYGVTDVYSDAGQYFRPIDTKEIN